jgi:hypothetical protein
MTRTDKLFVALTVALLSPIAYAVAASDLTTPLCEAPRVAKRYARLIDEAHMNVVRARLAQDLHRVELAQWQLNHIRQMRVTDIAAATRRDAQRSCR